jgi:hypothetical protein
MRNPILAALVCFALMSGCTCNKSKHIPDVSGIAVETKIVRFEDELFAVDTQSAEAGIRALMAKYPDFAPDFLFDRMFGNPAKPDTAAFFEQGRLFLADSFLRHLYDTCRTVYRDFSREEAGLREMLQFYKYYFPQLPTPVFYTTISGFNYDAWPDERRGAFVALSLDMTLGADYRPYLGVENLRHQYVRRLLTREQLLPNAARALALPLVPPPARNQMLDLMVAGGKQLAVVDALLPRLPDSTRLGWSAKQVEIVSNSETAIYEYLVDNKLLYSTRYEDFRKYVEMGPFDPEDPAANPNGAGNWLGWRMIRDYMEKTGATLPQVLEERDAQKFLKAYRPR